MDLLIERINQVQEMAEAKIANHAKARIESDEEEEVEVEAEGEQDPESPDSPVKKKKKNLNEPDSDDEREAEQAKKKAEEAHKAIMDKIELMEKQITTNHEEIRKAIDDDHFILKRIEQEQKNLDEKLKTNAANATAGSNIGAGESKTSGAQQEFNNMVRERLDDTEREINRL